MIVVADSGPLHYLILFDHVGLLQRSVGPDALAAVTDDLDPGERSAIAPAESLQADLLLIDEAAGRSEAKRRHLRVTGTLGVLRAGTELGLIDVTELVLRLQATSFYVGEALAAGGLRALAEATIAVGANAKPRIVARVVRPRITYSRNKNGEAENRSE